MSWPMSFINMQCYEMNTLHSKNIQTNLFSVNCGPFIRRHTTGQGDGETRRDIRHTEAQRNAGDRHARNRQMSPSAVPRVCEYL